MGRSSSGFPQRADGVGVASDPSEQDAVGLVDQADADRQVGKPRDCRLGRKHVVEDFPCVCRNRRGVLLGTKQFTEPGVCAFQR